MYYSYFDSVVTFDIEEDINIKFIFKGVLDPELELIG